MYNKALLARHELRQVHRKPVRVMQQKDDLSGNAATRCRKDEYPVCLVPRPLSECLLEDIQHLPIRTQ